MSKKGQSTTASILKWEDIEHLYNVALVNKMYGLCKFIIAGSYYGLHAEQITSLKWKDVFSDIFFVKGRDGKTLTIKNSQKAKKKFIEQFNLLNRNTTEDDYIILNRFGSRSSIQMLNRSLKQLNVYSKLNIKNLSTESFRKTFARHIYDILPPNLKDTGLKMLSQYLGHSSVAITTSYIGIDNSFLFDNPTEMFEYLELYSSSQTELSDKFIKDYTKNGFVYLLKDSTLPTLLKIGKTVDLSNREGTLQGEKPTYSLYKYVKLDCEKAAYALETSLHKRYAKYHVRGEWYELPENELKELLSEFSWEDANVNNIHE